MEEHIYSINSEIQETIEYLLSIGLPPLPVAPYQKDILNEDGKLKFTGKNPSYLDQSGKAHIVKHSNYREKLPNEDNLKEWFANPVNGIGTLGGINNIVFIDVDLKHFDSRKDLEKKMTAWGDKYIPDRKNKQKYWIESTQSGGLRIAARVKELPDFKNFSFEPQGDHVGEILGSASFTVLAPTAGLYGEYKNHGRDRILEVSCLKSIDIHPVRKKKEDNLAQSCRPRKKSHSSENDPNAIPLRTLANGNTQKLLAGDIEPEDRSEVLSTGIKEWHGWANWCCDNNIPYIEDALDLAYEAGEALGYDEDKTMRVYNTVDETGCEPAALYIGGKKSCWKKIRKLNREIYNTKCPKEMKLEIEQEMEEYKNSQNCRSVDIDVEPDTSLKPSNNENCRSVELIEADLETDKGLELVADKISRLTKKKKQTLDLSDFLPQKIADPFKQVSEAMPTSPEMLLTTFLSSCASLIGTSASIRVWSNWKEPSIIWTINVAPTGYMKSPTMKAIIKPLWDLETQSKEKGDTRDYIEQDITFEALVQRISQNPKGLLLYRDELDGFFQSMNQYRNGRGDDQQKWLSTYNGEPIKYSRKTNDEQIRISKVAVSITGSIQPETLKKTLNSENTTSGFNARWLYCYPEMPLPLYTGKEAPDIIDLLLKFYSKLDKLPHNVEFYLSEEAKNYFIQKWNNPIVKRGSEENSEAIKAILSKYKGYCVRIALILHCVEEVCKLDINSSDNETVISKKISLDTIKKSISLSQYYLDQAEVIYALVNDSEDSVPKEWIRCMEISERKEGWITARDVIQGTKIIKSADAARELFIEMSKDGFGQTRYEGTKLQWQYTESIEIGSTLLQNPKSQAA